MPRTRRKPRYLLSSSLQNKILMLVLVPLLLITIILVAMAAYDRLLASRATLAEQHSMLVEARKAAVRNVIEAAMSSIAPIVADAGPHDVAAQERAKEILRRFRFDKSNYVFVYDYQGKVLVQPMMPDREGTDGLDTQDRNGKPLIRDMIEIARKGGGFYQYAWPHPDTGEIEAKHSYAAGVQKWGWLVGAGVYATDIDAAMAAIEAAEASARHRFMVKTVLIGSAIFLAVAAIAIWLVRRTVRPIRRTASAMQDIAKGKGDLTQRLVIESDDEIGELANQFNAFVARMQDTLREVRAGTLSVYQAAGDIAQGSEELASRTEQAAANLQQTSASMEEITSTVNNSAESAQQANQLVLSTAEVARQGEAAMGQVERTMSDIDASAARIGDIVSLIDSIAFQTNILALNASVEAARAGEHGRGFAVVAQEVRILASRSSEASREIRTLIDDSVSHTRSGAELVRTAGQTMRDIATRVARVTAVIGEISTGAKEQSSGIVQVNTAVAEMDTMTQRNAAMVQQSATAAADMRLHAERLNRLIDTFVLGEEAPAHGAHKTLPAADPRTTTETLSSPIPIGQRSKRETVQEWETF